jgi:hypothetical protein
MIPTGLTVITSDISYQASPPTSNSLPIDSVGASIEGHMLHNLPMGIMRKKKKIRDIYRYSSLKPGVYKKTMTGPFVPPPPLSSIEQQSKPERKRKKSESRI